MIMDAWPSRKEKIAVLSKVFNLEKISIFTRPSILSELGEIFDVFSEMGGILDIICESGDAPLYRELIEQKMSAEYRSEIARELNRMVTAVSLGDSYAPVSYTCFSKSGRRFQALMANVESMGRGEISILPLDNEDGMICAFSEVLNMIAREGGGNFNTPPYLSKGECLDFSHFTKKESECFSKSRKRL